MSLKIVILFDISVEPPPNHDYEEYMDQADWESERAIFRALESAGHEPVLLGVYGDIYRLVLELKALKPDLVFNMAESFAGRRDREPHLAALLDLLGIAYTGTRPLGLSLCQDKGLSKKILSHHRIRVPRWTISRRKRPLKKLKSFAYPAFVKPMAEEGSEGISRDSFVSQEKDCLERVNYLHSKYQCDVIIEEFLSGREFYVGVLGLKRLEVLPIRELCFNEFPEDLPKFATFKAKWDDEYRKRWGIRTEFAKDLSEAQQQELVMIAKKSFDILQLHGYARFDFRISAGGEAYLIEANPNPSLAPEDDFAQSAGKAGYTYNELISKIVELATSVAE